MDVTALSNGWIIALWFGVLGLCVGSFVNVVCYRWPIIHRLGGYKDGIKHQELVSQYGRFTLASPRSSCPCCHTPIKAYHNIPVLGWLLLRGKCSSCGSKISWTYPATEFAFGIAFAGFVWFEGLWLAGMLTLPMMAIGFCIIWIRIQHGLIAMPFAVAYIVALVAQMLLTGMGYSSYL